MTRLVSQEQQADATRPLVSLSDTVLLCGMVVLRRLNWPVMKLSAEHAPPVWLAVRRFATSNICLLAFGMFRGDLCLPSRGDPPMIAASGCCKWQRLPRLAW